MTPDLDAVRAMVEGVNPGPLDVRKRDPHGWQVVQPAGDAELGNWHIAYFAWEKEARFYAAARELVPALAAEVEANRKTIAGLWNALNTADDALTEAEAILGGEYGDHYGPLCETMLKLREEIAALKGSEDGK